MIHKEGRASIIIGIIVSVLLIGLAKIEFPALKSLLAIAVLLSLFIMILLLQFFRNPKRPCFQNRDQVLSPADGTVVVIEETVSGRGASEKGKND